MISTSDSSIVVCSNAFEGFSESGNSGHLRVTGSPCDVIEATGETFVYGMEFARMVGLHLGELERG